MEDCRCKYEKDMGALMATVKNHDKIINGNGQKGLTVIVAALNERLDTGQKSQDELRISINNLRTAVSGVVRFQNETEAEVRAEEKQKATKQVRTTNWQWIITTSLMVGWYLVEKFVIK